MTIEIINLIFLHFLEVLLHCAARDGHSDLVQMLIAEGIDVNIMDKVSTSIGILWLMSL